MLLKIRSLEAAQTAAADEETKMFEAHILLPHLAVGLCGAVFPLFRSATDTACALRLFFRSSLRMLMDIKRCAIETLPRSSLLRRFCPPSKACVTKEKHHDFDAHARACDLVHFKTYQHLTSLRLISLHLFHQGGFFA